MKLRFEIEIDDVLMIETDTETLYLKTSCIAAANGSAAHYVELQAIDNNGKCRMIELNKVDILPKEWKKSSFRRIKLNEE